MKQESIKEKIKTFCRKVGKRNFIIFGAVVLIATAVVPLLKSTGLLKPADTTKDAS